MLLPAPGAPRKLIIKQAPGLSQASSKAATSALTDVVSVARPASRPPPPTSDEPLVRKKPPVDTKVDAPSLPLATTDPASDDDAPRTDQAQKGAPAQTHPRRRRAAQGAQQGPRRAEEEEGQTTPLTVALGLAFAPTQARL